MSMNPAPSPGSATGLSDDRRDAARSETEARAWKRRYDRVAAAAGQVTYEYDSATGGILWGGSLGAVLGYSLAEMEGGVAQWTALIHPEDREGAIRALEESRRVREPYDATYRFRHKAGHYAWINDRGLWVDDTALRGS